MDGFILEVCSIITRDEPDGGTVDLERFETWVDDHLVNVLGDYTKGETRSVVVLDNASVHHSDYVLHTISAAAAKVIYTAPYSPDLNPIELIIGQYKAALKRHILLPWDEAHLLGLVSVTRNNARNYYRKCSPRLRSFLYQR
jgi:hypothetical protein